MWGRSPAKARLGRCRATNVAGGLTHEPKVPQQDKQGADGYRRAYDLVGQFPFLHQKASVRQPGRRNLEAIRASDARKAPPERGQRASTRVRPPARSTSEPAAKEMTTRDRLCHRAARTEYSQRLRPSYTVSPAGQRLKRRAPHREPREPLGAQERPHRDLNSSGARHVDRNCGVAHPGPPASFNPSDQSHKRIL